MHKGYMAGAGRVVTHQQRKYVYESTYVHVVIQLRLMLRALQKY